MSIFGLLASARKRSQAFNYEYWHSEYRTSAVFELRIYRTNRVRAIANLRCKQDLTLKLYALLATADG
jgi:hypothetical protein